MTEKKTDRPRLADAVRGLAQDEHRALHFLATEEGLVAYHAGELSSTEEDLIRAYLAVTPEAADFVAELDAFLTDAEDQEQHLSEHESVRVWGRLKGELEAREAAPKPVAASVAAAPSRSGKGWIAAAAVLFVVAGASVIWGGWQQARVARYTTPNPESDLMPLRNGGQRSSSEGRILEIPDSWPLVTLLLDPSRRSLTFPSYRLELLDSDGRVMVRAPAAEDRTLSGFTLRLPTSRLPSGRYTLRLIGIQGEEESPVKEERFKVVRKE